MYIIGTERRDVKVGLLLVIGLAVSYYYIWTSFVNTTTQSYQGALYPKWTYRTKMTETRDEMLEEVCHIMHQANSCNSLPNYYLHGQYRPEYENAVITFVHLAKTGGDTMRVCLKALAARRGRPLPLPVDLKNYCSVLLKYKTNGNDVIDSDIIMGHRSFGMCDLIHGSRLNHRKCTYFTLLRDPFERIVSHYFYLRQTVGSSTFTSRSAVASIKMSIKEWSAFQGSELRKKLFWREDIGKHPNGSKFCKEASLLPLQRFEDEDFMNDILNNMDRHFGVIGLTSEYSMTLRMLQRAYHIPFYDVCKEFSLNEGDYNGMEAAARAKVKAEAIETLRNDDEIRKILHLDIKIYEKAKQIFNEQKRIMGKMEKNSRN